MARTKKTASQTSKAALSPVERLNAYVADVMAGRIIVGKWIRLAVERHVRDIEQSKDAAYPYFFDEEQANRVCRFMEMLPHVKGKWARRNPAHPEANKLRLEPWQCFATGSVFGWMVKGTERLLPSGKKIALRRFREADIWVARKNGKSTFACGWGHWMFTKDEEPGAEVYCGAGSEKQAWEVFGPARQMCIAEPLMTQQLGIEINAKSLLIHDEASLSKFEPVIGKPGDGSSPHMAVVDEYHEHATSEQFDTFKTGMLAREQPLLLVISTAGFNIAGPAKDRWDEGQKILEGTLPDERRFVLLYTVDTPDEWQTETGLRKANPNWGVSVNADTLLADVEIAKREASKQTAVKTKHANMWVSASSAYFNLEYWPKCHDPKLKLEDLAGQDAYMGGDLASKNDLVARATVFPIAGGRFAIFGRYYIPKPRILLPENQHLRKWADEGWITATPGEIVDLERFRDDILEDCGRFRVAEVAIDPWQATLLINELRGKNVNAYEFRQIVATMSEPMKLLDAWMRSGKLVHDGNPVTAWCLSNVTAEVDRKENVYPRKEKPQNKIDGAVALIMAIGRAVLQEKPMNTDAGVLFA